MSSNSRPKRQRIKREIKLGKKKKKERKIESADAPFESNIDAFLKKYLSGNYTC